MVSSQPLSCYSLNNSYYSNNLLCYQQIILTLLKWKKIFFSKVSVAFKKNLLIDSAYLKRITYTKLKD